MLVDPYKHKIAEGLTQEQVAKMEKEMEVLQRDLTLIEESHGNQVLNLVLARSYLAKLNVRLQHFLQQREDRSAGASLPEEKRKERLKKKKTNKPRFDLRAELFRMTGTDLTQIDGIDVRTAATVISEAGWDMSKWWTVDRYSFL